MAFDPADASTPARWSGTPNNGVNIDSASFTTPAGSILTLTVQADASDDPAGAETTDDIVIAVSDSRGLTWSERVQIDERNAGQEGYAGIWRAVDSAGGAVTVSVQRSAGEGGTKRISCKLYVGTGQHATPDGAVGEGTTTTNDTTPTLFTTTGADSCSYLSVCDWAQAGSPASSDGTEDSADYAGAISVMSAYEMNGAIGSVSTNINGGGTGGVEINWAAYEVLAAVAGGRITKNTRSAPLGVKAGMGFRMGT